MRQSIQIGFPQLVEKLAPKSDLAAFLKDLKPLTPEECRQAWEVPNPEFEALEHHAHNSLISPHGPFQSWMY